MLVSHKRKLCLAIILCLIVTTLRSQTKVISYLRDFALKDFVFTIKMTEDPGARTDFNFEIIDEKGKVASFTMKSIQSEVFSIRFLNALRALSVPDSIPSESIKEKGNEVFIAFLGDRSSELTPGPLAGVMAIEKEALGFYLYRIKNGNNPKPDSDLVAKVGGLSDVNKVTRIDPKFLESKPSLSLFPRDKGRAEKFNNKFMLIPKKFVIDSVQIEFNDGTIKNIKLVVHDTLRKSFIFHNPFPIPLSSFKEIQLLDGFVINNNLDQAIPVSNFLRYNPELTVDGQDYSPDNSVYSFNFSKPRLSVYKDNISRVLDARIYTDFLGVNKNNPNGLLQFEIGKKINRRAGRLEIYNLKKSVYPLCGITHTSYVYPYFNFAKIEQNNKFFGPVNNGDNIHTIELIRYGDLFGGAKLGVLTMELPNSKTNWSFEVAPQVSRFNYQRLVMSDSVATDTLTQHDLVFSALAGANIRLFPDSRYGITFSGFFQYMALQSSKIEQSDRRFLCSLAMEGFIKTGQELRNKLFFRMRYFTTMNDWDKTLLQLQFGCAFDIVKSRIN